MGGHKSSNVFSQTSSYKYERSMRSGFGHLWFHPSFSFLAKLVIKSFAFFFFYFYFTKSSGKTFSLHNSQ
jgi:hypothetical protein